MTSAETAPDDCLRCAINIALVQMDGTTRVCACGAEYARTELPPPRTPTPSESGTRWTRQQKP